LNLKGRAYLIEPMYIRKVFLSSMAGALALISMPASSQSIDLLAHRAVYEMTLESGGDAIGLVSVHGGLVIEVEDRCETWNVQQRVLMQILRQDGGLVTTSTYDSFEAKDGSWYRFEDETNNDPGPTERSAGEAVAATELNSASITIEEPEMSRHDMPEDAIFPMEHISDILERALAGERFMSHVLFDGTDGATVNDVTTIVGKSETIDGQTAWNMRLAFFDHGSGEELPNVEINALLRDDGVALALAFDYGDFIIRSELRELETLVEGGC
jgi:hypothetical protein